MNAKLKELDDKIKIEREKQTKAREENPKYNSPRLEELIAERKPIKNSNEQLNSKIKQQKIFTGKTYRYIAPIPISPQDGEKIIMEALEPLVRDKKRTVWGDNMEDLFNSDISDEEIIKPLKDAFLKHFKNRQQRQQREASRLEGKEDVSTRQKQYDSSTAIMEQVEDEFENLLRVFKTKNKLVDLSKFKISNINFEKILTNEVLGEELSKINDLTEIYNKYITNLQKLKEMHDKNIKKLEDSKKEKI